MKTVSAPGTTLLDYRFIVPFQGELKDLSEKNYNKLLASFNKHGFFVPIFIWQNGKDNWCLDGHGRLRVLNKEKIEFDNTGYEIPVHLIQAEDITDAKEKLLKITSQYQQITYEGLQNYIDEAELVDVEIYEAVHFDALPLLGQTNVEEVEEDEPPEVDDKETFSKPGEIYKLGKHRVMCGSATSEEDTNKLLGQQMIDLYLTDPPYNVDYTGKTKDALKIENDQMDDGEFLAFLSDANRRADEHMKSGASFYIFHADSEGYNFRASVKEVGWMLKQCLIWVKQTMVMGRQDYQWKHEPILYGWKSGASHNWFSDRKQTTVLEFDRPSRSTEHPTMKPLNILAYLIQNSTKAGDLVFDNFLGSGSTLMAADLVDRTCYGIELDPKYVDVIRKRYSKVVSPDDWETEWQTLTPPVI